MIEAVIFDIGNVLTPWSNDPFIEGILPSTDLSRDKLTKALFDGIWHEYETGTLSDDEYFAITVQRTEHSVSQRDFNNLIQKRLTGANREMIQLADDLSDAGYKLGLLSDICPQNITGLDSLIRNLDRFTYRTYSAEVGVVKPHDRMYEDIIQKVCVKPECMIFIDDKIENVTAARKHGLQSFVHTSADNTKNTLKELGVQW